MHRQFIAFGLFGFFPFVFYGVGDYFCSGGEFEGNVDAAGVVEFYEVGDVTFFGGVDFDLVFSGGDFGEGGTFVGAFAYGEFCEASVFRVVGWP